MLSCLSDVPTKVECLDLGAKDYLTKPFSLAELPARVRARLRGNALRERAGSCRSGDLTLDAGRLQADSGLGPVAADQAGVPAAAGADGARRRFGDQEQLLASVWGIEFDPGSNIVDVCIRRLRAKLGFAS